MMKKNGVWDDATKRYVYIRFMFGDSVTDITEPETQTRIWTEDDVEEILREAFKTLDTKSARLP